MSKKLEAGILSSVENNFEELRAIKKYLYDNPEVGGEEQKAARWCFTVRPRRNVL